jgi:hypothetical protein
MNKKPKIIDNFLPEETYLELKQMLTGNSFPWYYNQSVVHEKEDAISNEYQFTHIFLKDSLITSDFFNALILPFVKIIDPIALIRVKANLIMRSSAPVTHEWHTDIANFDEGYTAVYYVNTNNGKTLFKTKTADLEGEAETTKVTLLKTKTMDLEVESVANRLVVFPSSMLHAGVTTTDAKYRTVINFNFIGGNL